MKNKANLIGNIAFGTLALVVIISIFFGISDTETSWKEIAICITILISVIIVLYVLFGRKSTKEKKVMKEKIVVDKSGKKVAETIVTTTSRRAKIKHFFGSMWILIKEFGRGAWYLLGTLLAIVVVIFIFNGKGVVRWWKDQKTNVTVYNYVRPGEQNQTIIAPPSPRIPDRHELQFGENRMEPGEVWYFVGDRFERHYASKEDGSPILSFYTDYAGGFSQELHLRTENGIEQDQSVFARSGKIACGRPVFLTTNEPVTLLITQLK